MKNNLPACSLAQKLGILLAGAALGVFCTLGLSRKEAEPEPLSYESEFELALPFLGSLVGINYESPEQLQEVFEQFVNMRASYEWLEANGGMQDVTLQHALRKVAYEHLVRQRVDGSVKIQEVLPKEIETYYHENQSLFNIPARFRGFYLAWDPENTLVEALLEKIPSSTTSEEWESLLEEFDELWIQDSTTGLIPSMYARDWREHICPVPMELADALVQTEGTNRFVGPVVVEGVAHGFFIQSRQTPVTIPLRNVRSQVQRNIYRQRWDDRFQEVMKEISPNPRPTLDQEYLARIMESAAKTRLSQDTEPIPVSLPDF